MEDITQQRTLWNAVHLVLLRVGNQSMRKKKQPRDFGSDSSLKAATRTEKELGEKRMLRNGLWGCKLNGTKDYNFLEV